MALVVLPLTLLAGQRFLAETAVDECACIAAFAWLLAQTILLVRRVLFTLRPSGLVREVLAHSGIEELSYRSKFDHPARQPESFLRAREVLVRAAELGEAEEVCGCLSEMARALTDLLSEASDTEYATAIAYLRWRLIPVPQPNGSATEWMLDYGLGGLLRALRYLNPQKTPAVKYQLYALCVALCRDMTGRGLRPQYVLHATALCGADYFSQDRARCLELSDSCIRSMIGPLRRTLQIKWLGASDKQGLEAFLAALGSEPKHGQIIVSAQSQKGGAAGGGQEQA